MISTPSLLLLLVAVLSAGCGADDAAADDDSGPDAGASQAPAPVVDTGQSTCYDVAGNARACAGEGEVLSGQDAQYRGVGFALADNGDGTVSDQNTGLMWQQTPDFDRRPFSEAADYCASLAVGGHDDWRLPTIKELFSIADFRGQLVGSDTSISTPYLDETYFDFEYPAAAGEEYAGQYWSSTLYVKGPIVSTGQGVFGFNFSDGHIKAYPAGYAFGDPSTSEVAVAEMYIRCVRGEENVYGQNDFEDNSDGTIADRATGLTWQRDDDGVTRAWDAALSYCEGLSLAGHDDWRLPNAKELQSIVDYDKEEIPAIDDVFGTSNPESWFWTSTTHGDNKAYGVYIAFGKAYGKNAQQTELTDWHGAGAQRSDPKTGDPADYDLCSVNACDEVRIANYVRCVRGGAEHGDPDQAITYCDSGSTGESCCGDDSCSAGEDLANCPQDCQTSSGGPVACDDPSDCLAEGACPPDAALGCDCETTPQGDMCVPTCETADDCPSPPGMTLTCSPDGLCVPSA